MRSVFCSVLALAAVAAAGTGMVQAQADANPSTARFQLGFFAPTGDVSLSGLEVEVDESSYENTFGVGLNYEYRFGDIWGVDFGVKYFKPDIELGRFSDEARFVPWTVGFNYHFGNEGWQFYAGPELAYIMYGNPDFPGWDIDDELTWGVKAGVDVPWQGNWAFNASVEYLAAKADMRGTDLDPKPFIITVGAGYRF